jgi:membrane protein CcdC involved in cytochrome C biogenesis
MYFVWVFEVGTSFIMIPVVCSTMDTGAILFNSPLFLSSGSQVVDAFLVGH